MVPDDVRETSYWASENDEKLDLDATLDLLRAESTPGSFDSHPLVILTPSTPNSGNLGEGGSQGLPGPRVPELDELYLPLEAEMQNLPTDSMLIFVDDSGHCIMCDQPDVFFDALQEVIRAASSPRGSGYRALVEGVSHGRTSEAGRPASGSGPTSRTSGIE